MIKKTGSGRMTERKQVKPRALSPVRARSIDSGFGVGAGGRGGRHGGESWVAMTMCHSPVCAPAGPRPDQSGQGVATTVPSPPSPRPGGDQEEATGGGRNCSLTMARGDTSNEAGKGGRSGSGHLAMKLG
ncbi:uncharacterized protein EI97DRAFT_122742 [Westerdykella ornata]|uniref:Uncharacterized protein n=1 Tax=Westerdykella ornata TaxID=318751 RepID=A0A6A6JX76_WESOR|nr:uncharacterized protein EI97DRAFT_122742 [Westerdykella ornata]KAF2280418.1 hypothetical protein EI97DRAFT_122742 [Westerdykella ornata]